MAFAHRPAGPPESPKAVTGGTAIPKERRDQVVKMVENAIRGLKGLDENIRGTTVGGKEDFRSNVSVDVAGIIGGLDAESSQWISEERVYLFLELFGAMARLRASKFNTISVDTRNQVIKLVLEIQDISQDLLEQNSSWARLVMP